MNSILLDDFIIIWYNNFNINDYISCIYYTDAVICQIILIDFDCAPNMVA